MAADMIGRDPELASVASLLDGLASGPAALLIEGEAGIGKTTLWTAGVATALERRCRVLRCRPAEAQLSFAALGDLLEGVLDEALPLLPAPQRHALEVAMLRDDGGSAPVDQRAVAVAALGVVRRLAGSGPLVVAVDDGQWLDPPSARLDPPSARVLEFVVRRLTDEPVGFLAAVRTSGAGRVLLGLDQALPPDRLTRLRVGPLSLERAAEAGIIELDGERIRFIHPLLGSALYSQASNRQRQALHRQLARVVADPEERARHQALGADGPDAEVAGMLDGAAALARSRGAPDAAAELLELAGRLTPTSRVADRWRRTTDAARYHYEAGDPTRACRLLEPVLAGSPSGVDRARALLRLATVLHDSAGPASSVPLLQEALRQAGDDPTLRMEVERELAHDLWLAGDFPAARLHAGAAVERAERLGDRLAIVAAQAHELIVVSALDGVTPELVDRAASLAESGSDALEGAGLTNLESARQTRALLLMLVGELDRARDIYLEEARRVVEQGRDWEREYVAWYLARLEYRAGNFQRAAQHAEASYTESLGREGLHCEAL